MARTSYVLAVIKLAPRVTQRNRDAHAAAVQPAIGRVMRPRRSQSPAWEPHDGASPSRADPHGGGQMAAQPRAAIGVMPQASPFRVRL
jgi:hypothetical protein